MSNIAIWLTPIEAGLRAHADAQQAVPMKAYMLGQFEFLGLRAGPRREALKQALQGLPRFTGAVDELLTLTEALWRLPEREFRYAAIDLLARHYKHLDVNALPRILTLVQTGKSEPVPVVLFGSSYWKKLINFESLVEAGAISADDLKLFSYVDTPEAAWQVIQSFYQLKN